MSACLICLRSNDGIGQYHARCLRSLFGSKHVPQPVDIDLARLHTVGLAMVGRTTLSGVQRKISVNLSTDRQTLQVALPARGGSRSAFDQRCIPPRGVAQRSNIPDILASRALRSGCIAGLGATTDFHHGLVGAGRFILKPQSSAFPELPENELVTMRLAESAGLDIPACGLIALADGSMAYVARRFDRLESGGKLRQEDFCQLAELPPKRKYDGSAELCARLIRRYATEPAIESLKLFRQMVFCWWTGNGDAHLKNFSLLTGVDGVIQLSPAYDLLCTRLVMPDDRLALPVGGKQDGLRRTHWEDYGKYCGLPARSVARELARIVALQEGAIELVSRSPLGAASRARYADLLRERAASLA